MVRPHPVLFLFLGQGHAYRLIERLQFFGKTFLKSLDTKLWLIYNAFA